MVFVNDVLGYFVNSIRQIKIFTGPTNKRCAKVKNDVNWCYYLSRICRLLRMKLLPSDSDPEGSKNITFSSPSFASMWSILVIHHFMVTFHYKFYPRLVCPYMRHSCRVQALGGKGGKGPKKNLQGRPSEVVSFALTGGWGRPRWHTSLKQTLLQPCFSMSV